MIETLFSSLEHNPGLLLLYIGLLSLAIGSFLNVVIYRLPVMLENNWKSECRELLDQKTDEEEQKLSLSFPASRCPACGHKISFLENIPLISWLILKGRCSSCQTKISARYPAIELLTAILSIIVTTIIGYDAALLPALVFTWFLIALSFIDIDHQLLPDNMTLPLLWIGLFFNLFGIFVPISDAVIGAIAGYLSLWSVFHIFRIITGKDGMGYGDFKLLAVFGAWMGWEILPLILLLASLSGAIISITLMAFKKLNAGNTIPFGPYLAIAAWITLLWGDSILQSYFQLL